MAQPCLFTNRLSVVVVSKSKLNFQIFKNYYAQFHKQVLSRQYETATKEDIPKQDENEPEIQKDCKEVDVEGLKMKILHASLAFVPEHGWSEKSLALEILTNFMKDFSDNDVKNFEDKGAQSLGLSAASHTLIPGGGPEIVHYFNFSCNVELENHLKKNSSPPIKVNLQEFLSDALANRLKMVIPFLPKWPEAMALMALPTQLPAHTRNVLDLVDIVWHCYGDTSLNMSWYSKRIALAVAYKTSELSMIQDKSEDFSDTFDFLQKRVENVVEADSLVHSVNENGKHFLEFGSGAFITARNLLGLNRWFR